MTRANVHSFLSFIHVFLVILQRTDEDQLDEDAPRGVDALGELLLHGEHQRGG